MIPLISENANDSDQALCGILRLYNPAGTTFVKHFLSTGSQTESGGGSDDHIISFHPYQRHLQILVEVF